jgi:uncharacterized SAM-binding protein YcdF (DUF218 family)
MSAQMTQIPPAVRTDVEVLYDFNQLHQELRPCSVGIGLGSHDPNVPAYAAELYHRHFFPLLVFTGANAPTTIGRFPRGEAVHFREIAIEHGVPARAIQVETEARNTGENVTLTRDLLVKRGVPVHSVLVICRPYQQRRAYATFRAAWPDVDVICASQHLPLDDYVSTIGDPKLVIDMIVGDTQRVIEYPQAGFAAEQPVPERVHEAYRHLVEHGFTSRLIKDG